MSNVLEIFHDKIDESISTETLMLLDNETEEEEEHSNEEDIINRSLFHTACNCKPPFTCIEGVCFKVYKKVNSRRKQ